MCHDGSSLLSDDGHQIQSREVGGEGDKKRTMTSTATSFEGNILLKEPLTVVGCLSFQSLVDLTQEIADASLLRYNNNDDDDEHENDADGTPLQTEQVQFPTELTSFIVNFLVILPVQSTDVTVTRASSDRNDFELCHVLVDDSRSWWISDNFSMPNGRGEEYIQFQLASSTNTTITSTTKKKKKIKNDSLLRRVHSVLIRIPPLPMGPLSVRDFRIDYSQDEDGLIWTQGQKEMKTSNVHGLQQFDLSQGQLIDAIHVRFVCLSNQFSVAATTTATGDDAAEEHQQRLGGVGESNSRLVPPSYWSVGLYTVQWR